MKNWLILFGVVLVLSVFIWLEFPKTNEDLAIQAIIGEAANQSDDTMICVAQGLRHRGNFKGVYGIHAHHNLTETPETIERARDAWIDSELVEDKIRGARNWGSTADLIKLGIHAGDLKAHCGDLYFY